MVVIAFSGLPGTGSSTAGRLLAESLGVEFFSVGAYNKEHAKIVAKKDVEKETEKAVVMWKIGESKLKEFHLGSDEIARQKAKKGNIVIEGKLAIRMIKGLCDFSVWIKAPVDVRARRISGRDGTIFEEAKKMLVEKEKLETENWLRIYDFDYHDQEKEADIVIDTSDKTPEQIVDMIIKKMKSQKVI